MSTVVQVIEPPAQPQSPPSQGAAKTLRWIGKNSWALADQVLISAANFVTQVFAARAMPHDEFGTFGVIFGVLLWCNIFQSTLITQAHNVLGAIRKGHDYRRYTSSTAVGQLILLAIEIGLTVPVAAFAFWRGWTSAGMLVALIPAIVAWQLMEFARRVLYTEGRYAAAFLNDMVGYGGSIVALGLLYLAHTRHQIHFTGALALYALAAASALAAVMGAWQLRHSLVRAMSKDDLKENWHFGKWLAGGELLGWCSSIHMMVWWAAIIIGTAASADLRAAQILFGPTRVIAFFLGTVLPIRFSRTLHRHGPAALHHSVNNVYVVLAPLVGVYCVLLAIFPRPLLHLMYGPEYAASGATVLQLYALSAFISYMQMVVAAALTAARQTHLIFAGSVVGCIIALIMSPLFIYYFNSNGAIVSIIVTTLVVTVLYILAYRKQLKMTGFAAIPEITEEPT